MLNGVRISFVLFQISYFFCTIQIFSHKKHVILSLIVDLFFPFRNFTVQQLCKTSPVVLYHPTHLIPPSSPSFVPPYGPFIAPHFPRLTSTSPSISLSPAYHIPFDLPLSFLLKLFSSCLSRLVLHSVLSRPLILFFIML